MSITQSAVMFFFMLNSIGTGATFLAITKGQAFRQRLVSALVAVSAAGAVLIPFLWLGERIMTFFGLSLFAFEIGGGIVLFKIGAEMLNCTTRITQLLDKMPRQEPDGFNAIVPLGIPLLAGPATIAVAVTLTASESSPGASALTLALILGLAGSFLVWAVWGLVFRAVRFQIVSQLISRLGGLFLMIVAVQMVANGIIKVGGVLLDR